VSFPLSLEKETLEKKEDEEEEMRKQNQCAAKSLVFPSKTTLATDRFGN